MHFLLVQLSDIHLRSGSNPVVGRLAPLVRAIRSADADVGYCVLLLSGDVAQSGHDEEYTVAFEMLAILQARLEEELGGTPVKVAVIPGNHDCDLRGEQRAREALKATILKDQTPIVPDSIVDICADAQRSFFDFRDAVSDATTLTTHSKLFWDYRFDSGFGVVQLCCLNTAWLSTDPEEEGHLYFPPSALPTPQFSAITLTALHHPFNWFPNENKRMLQQRLEQLSDIILTGHEHAHSRRVQTLSTGEVNEFIEGAALQTWYDAEESSFNVLLLDLQARRQRFIRYEWNDDLYSPVEPAGEWEAFQVSRLRAKKDFQVTDEFAERLRDPEIALERRGKGRLLLPDVFVYPELRDMTARSGTHVVLGADQVLERSLTTPHVLIIGPEQSGKTALAKSIFGDLASKGFVPVLIDGAKLALADGDRLTTQMLATFVEQYGHGSVERYKQLEPPRRAVIIDNFHKARGKSGSSARFLESLERFAGRIVLFSDDLAHSVGEIVTARSLIEERGTFLQYRLLPFGHVRRSELIERWYLLGSEYTDDQLAFAQHIKNAEQVINIILGKNYVPAFPVFILAVLQGLDSASPLDTNASTYGSFYELLVRLSLAAGSNKHQFDVHTAFLALLAYRVFQSGSADISEAQLRAVHKEYEQWSDISVDRASLFDDLLKRRVLVRYGDTFQFKYRYTYYYFVASYLRDSITSDATRKTIVHLCAELHDEENANIVLFLAHLSKEPLIIEEMLRNAESQFAEYEPARLEQDVAFLQDLQPPQSVITYDGRSIEENRREQKRALDRLERDETSEDEKMSTTAEYKATMLIIGRMLAAFKTVQILGQLLKNFPGSIEASLKERIARASYDLGFRTLGSLIALLREGKEDIVAQLMTAFRDEYPRESEERLLRRASAAVFGLGVGVSYGAIKRMSNAVGSPSLDATYERVLRANGSVGVQLVNLSIRLDQLSGFPQGEILRLASDLEDKNVPFVVLQWMVVNHINLFPVNFKAKQVVLEALDVKAPSLGLNPQRRLIAPSKDNS